MTDELARAIAEAQQEIEDLCPHEADEHAEGCCDVCDLTFAAVSVLYDLAAAIAPLIERTVAAAAWQEGYTSGHSNAMRRMSDEPNAPSTPNPYREEVRRG